MKIIKVLFLTIMAIGVSLQGMEPEKPTVEKSAWNLSSLFSFNMLNFFTKDPTTAVNYPKEYSINLMWINRQAYANQEYIYPATKENNFGKEFLDTTLKWAKQNPEGTINLWFDSLLTTKEAIQNTQECINQEILKCHNRISKIELKDIRQLTRVHKNPEIFSTEIPVYFRADLSRAIVAEEMIRQNKNSYFVYADFDVKPMTKIQLFDRKTLDLLNKYNFVMAKTANKLGFENGFQIFTYNEKLLKAMRLMLIKANILRAHTFLEEAKEKEDPNSILNNARVWKIQEIGFQENVFYSYPLMYTYFCQLQNTGSLMLSKSNTSYNKDRDDKDVLNNYAKIIMCHSSALVHMSNFPMPTKQVSVPPTTSAYNELTRSKL